MSFEEGPLYYREIQKNAYLKRVPNETTGSKLLQLGQKKVSLKPMWTLFCIHNGRTPYLEQYTAAACPHTLAHRPVWAACLRRARHVTASASAECDFRVHTDTEAVTMRASDWETMQDWVTTLRTKLQELKILSSGENVYCSAPAAPLPRAPARDPTSPLPPTPPVPPDRVPGIELIPPRPPPEEQNPPDQPQPPQPVDISNWEEDPQPSTSTTTEQPQSVAKICGQNICLDDSILRRRDTEDFFDDDEESEEYKQTVKVKEANEDIATCEKEPQATNITVIQVSNKNPPHTAIPVLGPETDVFTFDFNEKVNLTVNDNVTIQPDNSFVNIVNTEDRYGAIFNDGDYGHLSLTTTVNLTDDSTVNLTNNSTVKLTNDPNNIDTNQSEETKSQEGVYERLCMASTSNENVVSRLKHAEKVRKSSLPNLDTANESTYEYLYPNNNVTTNRHEEIVNSRTTNGDRQDRTVNVVCCNSDVRVRTNIERSQSQNAYDSGDRVREMLIRPSMSPKRDGNKTDKSDSSPAKPIWKRGLTEFSLLTKLRIGGRRHDSPTRQEPTTDSSRAITSPEKVVRRSRPEGRIDGARRRSSSLNNGEMSPVPLPPPPPPPPPPQLQPLRARQAAALRAEQRRGSAVAASVSVRDPPAFVDYEHQVWICCWGNAGRSVCGRAGDRVAAVGRLTPRSAQHAALLLKQDRTLRVDILFHRVPLGKIYVINRRDNENIGIKLDGECNIVRVSRGSPGWAAGVRAGRGAVTEVNNRPLNLLKGGEEEMHRLSMHGSEVSILIQPSTLVKKIRSALKANKFHIR
ncbi:uncharacterized protein LOC128682136 [Plodia interpunctella]|uniref:uncharacterized protein LOC128682136 n=1 Tax=Plodia interpunctella TaxID=58824 RepID=UPI002368E5EC|nr:uncharacterized protein LOC128682136 [Plodia interpunctella]